MIFNSQQREGGRERGGGGHTQIHTHTPGGQEKELLARSLDSASGNKREVCTHTLTHTQLSRTALARKQAGVISPAATQHITPLRVVDIN